MLIFWEENFFRHLFSPNEFFCAKNIFSSHLATVATGSANPVTGITEGWGYTHDGRADKYPYPHDCRADKDSYPHDRNVTDDLCSLIKLCFAFIMVLWLNFRLNVFYCYSCWKLFTLNSAWIN